MNWAEAILEVKNAHADQILVASKLEEFVTGLDSNGNPVTSVTFDFADGTSSTVQTIPQIVSSVSGGEDLTAGYTTVIGDPYKRVMDTLEYKLLPSKASVLYTGFTDITKDVDICVMNGTGFYVAYYVKSDSTSWIRFGYEVGGLITWSAAQAVAIDAEFGIMSKSQKIKIVYASGDAQAGTFVVSHINTANELCWYVIRMTAPGVFSVGAVQKYASDTTMERFHLDYDITTNKIHYVIEKSGVQLWANVATINGTAKTIAFGAQVKLVDGGAAVGHTGLPSDAADTINGWKMAYDPDLSASGGIILNYVYTDDSKTANFLYSLIYDYNSTVYDSAIDVKDTDNLDIWAMKLDKIANKLYCVIEDVSTMYLVVYEYDGKYLNEIARSKILMRNTDTFDEARKVNFDFDLTNQKFYAISCNDTATAKDTYIYDFTINDNYSLLQNIVHNYVQGGTNAVGVPCICSNKGGTNASDTLIRNGVIVFDAISLLFDCDERNKFCGFVEENANAGNAGLCSVLGGISNAHSGLTTGTKYYLQADLTVSPSPTPYPIGYASSATKIRLFNR